MVEERFPGLISRRQGVEYVKNQNPLLLYSTFRGGLDHILEHSIFGFRKDKLCVRDLDMAGEFKGSICGVGAGPNPAGGDNAEKDDGVEDLYI